MLDKKRGYAYNRPFYAVDVNVNIMAGMVAFLVTNAAGVTVATTAASGTVPIGTFWKDRSTSFTRSFMESGTFNVGNIIALSKGNVRGTAFVRVTNVAGTVVYTQGVDYTVITGNGLITRLGTGTIPALATVIVTYQYVVQPGREHWDFGSTSESTALNYDRQPDDTLGSSKITVAEGDAKIYTDQFDVTQTYALNAPLRSNAASLWTSGAGVSSVCGRVVKAPTAADPFLGLDQVRVAL